MTQGFLSPSADLVAFTPVSFSFIPLFYIVQLVEVAPLIVKCLNGVDGWIPLRLLRLLEHLAVLKIHV